MRSFYIYLFECGACHYLKLYKYIVIYGAGHETAALLLPGFAINW